MKYCSLLLAIFVIYSCATPTLPEEVLQSIAQVKEKYAPDKRVALFNIEAQSNKKTILFICTLLDNLVNDSLHTDSPQR